MTDFRDLLRRALQKIDELEARLQAAPSLAHEPIAIVGLACRFPGGETPEEFWASLVAGRDSVVPVPPERLGLAAPAPGPANWAGLLESVDGFDPVVFGISPREAAALDPQQRLLLEVCYEALEDAGAVPARLSGSATGVFVGLSSLDYKERVDALPAAALEHAAVLGSIASIAAGRIAYTLGLRGPAVAIDTACSSSLVAVHLAALSLRSRETDLALAGGVNVILSQRTFDAVRATQALSPDGKCKTFDARANGFVRGEGCGIVALRRLSDAQRDGDRVLAILRASAVNQDGRSTGLTAPSGLAQEALLRAALERGGVQPAEVSYLETHGTGTSLGDPIEVGAIRAVYGAPREAPCYLGALKTSVGHLEAAAGVAGLIKAVLALRSGFLPGNLHFQALNPLIDLRDTPLRLLTEGTPWPAVPRRICGVSSFGISGTNAHVLVEAAPAPAPVAEAKPARAEVLVLSAESPRALTAAAARLQARLSAEVAPALADVGYTLRARRAHLGHRLAVLAATRAEAALRLGAAAQGTPSPHVLRGQAAAPPPLSLLFTGQGAQHAGMGAALYAAFPAFRAALDRCAAGVDPELEQPLRDVLFAPAGSALAARLDQTAWTQVALFALEYALFALWTSWGLVPSVLLGHSVGELAAACVAGVFSLEDGLRLVAARGRLMQALPPGGAMLAIEASELEALRAVARRPAELALAAVNGPRSVVLSGTEAAVTEAADALTKAGHRARRLRVSHAFHSPLLAPMLAGLRAVAATIRYRPPAVPLVSNVTGRLAGPEILTPDYWVEQARSPVRFADGVQAAVAAGARGFLELGPSPTLLALVRACLPAPPRAPGPDTDEASGGDRSPLLVPSMQPNQPETETVLGALARLHVAGAPVQIQRLDPAGGPGSARPVTLPGYPFQRTRFVLQPAPAPHPAGPAGPSLPGTLLRLAGPQPTFAWQARLDAPALAYLAEHRVAGAAIAPAAAFLDAALTAARQLLGPGAVALRDVRLHQALVLRSGAATALQTVLTEEGAGSYRVHLASAPVGAADDGPSGGASEGPLLHATARATPWPARAADTAPQLPHAQERCLRPVPLEPHYAQLRARGLDYGPAFRGLAVLLAGSGEALGLARLAAPLGAADATVHPALLDACFQTATAALGGSVPEIPVAIGAVRCYRPAPRALWCHARVTRQDGHARIDLDLWDEAGELVAEVAEIELRPLAPARDEGAEQLFYRVAWQPAPPEVLAPGGGVAGGAGRFLLVAESAGGFSGRLAAQLVQGGAQAVVFTPPAGDGAGVQAALEQALRVHGPLRGVVCLAGLSPAADAPADGSLDDAAGWPVALAVAQALARSGRGTPGPALTLLSERAQRVAGDERTRPEQALVWGLGAALHIERPELRCRRIDLGGARAMSGPADEAAAVAQLLLAGSAAEPLAVRGSRVYTARLEPTELPVPPPPPIPEGERAVRLLPDPAAPGRLDALKLRSVRRRAPGPGEVEIAVTAAGVNFRDVLLALDLLPSEIGGVALGLGGECAGRVVRTGPGVTELQPGDAILAAGAGFFGSHATLPATLVFRAPAGLSAEAGAGLLIVHATVYHALHEVAGLRAGERVLIHSASGGVGQAAIQWARHVGAQILATAGSEPKRAALRAAGITCVSDSRSERFVTDVRAATAGQGVDVVLNTLSGPLLQAGLSVLSDFGRFVDLTKRDHIANHGLGLAPFLRGLSYALVDLNSLAARRPERFRALVGRVLEQVAAGLLRPLPTTVLPLAQAEDAFRRMSQPGHQGKLVLVPAARLPGPAEAPEAIEPGAPPPRLARADGSYLITGGLGGLGLVAAEVLARGGAGHLLLLGRSGARGPVAAQALARIEAAGARVTIATQDVGDEPALAALLRALPASQPLRGVIHTAGVLDDALLEHQTPARFAKVLAGKAAGALILDRRTRGAALDFFVLYSSAASVLGAAGQANYVAANALLDALAQRRAADGLPATTINWGPVEDTGMTRSAKVQARLARLGGLLSQAESARALTQVLLSRPVQVTVTRLLPAGLVKSFPHLAGWSFLAALAPAAGSSAGPAAGSGAGLREALRSTSGEARRTLLHEAARRHVAAVLHLLAEDAQRITPDTALVRLGLDSLLSLELQNRIQAELGLTLAGGTLLGDARLRDLVQALEERLDAQTAAVAYDEGEI